MPSPIIDSNETPDPMDDPLHPIPSLSSIDVMAVKDSGGADLIVVVASPLSGDAASQTRLLDKIQGYLGYIGSSDFRAEAGFPNPSNTTVVVKLHPESAPDIHDLLAKSKEWVLASQASLRVEILTALELGAGT